MKNPSLLCNLLGGFRYINQKIPIYLFGILIILLWSNSLAAQSPNMTKLTASDGAEFDRFGYSVSISGDHLLVGAWGDDDNGDASGSVYIYEKDANGTWGSEQKLMASDGADGDWFGNSVSISGDQLLVGAPYDDDNGDDSGSVYVYEKDANGIWGNEQKLTASDGADYDYYGSSVSISGDQLLVGARGDNYNGSSFGSVYVYEKDANGTWGSEQKLMASDGATLDFFGSSVSISGDQLLVGAYRDDDNGDDSGSVYVYEKDANGTWGNEQKLTASDGAADDYFGYSVSISGDQLLVGAWSDDDKVVDIGSVYVYEKDENGIWGNEQKLTASDGAADDHFGSSVSISGDQLLVGAAFDDDNGDDSGSVYVYEKDANGTWGNEQKFTASDAAADDLFGYSISISGDQLVVGAWRDDDNGYVSGSVYFIDLDNTCNPICNDLTIQLDNSGNAGVLAADVFGGYDGACTMSSLELSLTTFDSSNIGDNLVTLTVYDSNNNSSSCEAMVTVNSTTDNKQISTDKFCLYQNIPNPFNEQTIIRFNLTESGKVILTITNVDGKVIERIEGDYNAGMHTIELMNLQKAGIYYYQLETERFSGTRKMVKI